MEKKYYPKDKVHVLSLKKNIRKEVAEEFYIVLKFRLWQNGRAIKIQISKGRLPMPASDPQLFFVAHSVLVTLLQMRR